MERRTLKVLVQAICALAKRAWIGLLIVSCAAFAGSDKAQARLILPSNVAQLRLAFAVKTERVGAESGAPAFAAGLLYVLTPFPHQLLAFDPLAPAANRLRWQFAPPADRRADGLMCCDRSDHGPVASGGRVFFTTQDGRVIAVDATSGQVIFSVTVADLEKGESLAGPPTIAEGRVFVGNAGDDFGVRGWIAALDAQSGQLIWKRFSTGSDVEVGISTRFTPFYDVLRGRDLGIASWPPGAWEHGGGSVATAIHYDPATHLVFHSTGHPAPWNADQRGGDERWTSGLFARDAETGEARWFNAFNPGNPFAYRSTSADLLTDRTWKGQQRSLLIHPDSNGILYVIDRLSGELLAADAITASVVSTIDEHAGQSVYAPSKIPKVNRQTRDICPAWTGGVGYNAAAADSGVVLLPVSRLCMDYEPRSANFIRGTPYTGANVRLLPASPSAGRVVAWDVALRRIVWQLEERLPLLGGISVTKSGVAFYGTLDGFIRALDAKTGRVLWQYQAPSGVIGRPVNFSGNDGQEYLAVVAGTSRLFGISRKEALDPRDPGAGFGLAGLVGTLPEEKDARGTLLVFRLP